MRRWDDTPSISRAAIEGSYQGIRDPTQLNVYGNDVAQRHQNGSKLSRVARTRQTFESDTEADVTTALTAPHLQAQKEWPGPLPGAEPITSTSSARRDKHDAGSSTCVTLHPDQHERRGRRRTCSSGCRSVRHLA